MVSEERDLSRGETNGCWGGRGEGGKEGEREGGREGGSKSSAKETTLPGRKDESQMCANFLE